MKRIIAICLLSVPLGLQAQVINQYAGAGYSGYSGDGGPAAAATFNLPNFVRINAAGALFVSDYGNNAVRKIGGDGVITTFAGNGVLGYSGDGGPATAAKMNHSGSG